MTADTSLPENLKSMLRVDQAGEYGAIRIYQGQMDVMKRKGMDTASFQTMQEQEKEHLHTFNTLMMQHRIQPTLLTPLWHVGGYILGAVTAAISEKAAHACTIAVEEVIEEHYQKQIDALSHDHTPKAQELKEIFIKFQEEEIHHKKTAEEQGGREAPLFPILTTAIKTISKAAIWASKRI